MRELMSYGNSTESALCAYDIEKQAQSNRQRCHQNPELLIDGYHFQDRHMEHAGSGMRSWQCDRRFPPHFSAAEIGIMFVMVTRVRDRNRREFSERCLTGSQGEGRLVGKV